MNKAVRLFGILFSLWMAFLPWGMECQAAGEYTYTVTFYPGNHGTFDGTGSVSVQSTDASGVTVSMEGQAIKVHGLRNGDMVSFDAAMDGAVALGEGSRYYVKGIRLSGRDNNTVDTSAFRVEGDRDYVVAYGIRGDMVSYVVNYQDGMGNALAPSRSYYGNVGDKPVAAFLYVEGYEPMAYNLTKTLSANEAENVFTFVYTRVPAGEGNTPGSGGNTGDGSNTGAGAGNTGDGTADIAGEGTGNDMDGDAGTEGEGTIAGAADGDLTGNDETGGMAGNNGEEALAGGDGDAAAGDMADGAEAGGMVGNLGENGEETELGEGDVPLDLMELDDEEIPLADRTMANMEEEGSRMITLSVAVAIASAALFVFFAVWLWKWAKRPH